MGAVAGEQSVDSKTKLGLGAALVGAFALGGVSMVAFSTAEPSATSGAGGATPDAEQTVRIPAPVMITERAPVETSFSDLQEDEIRALIHEYLMTNPEVILEAVNEYQRRREALQQEQAVKGARENLARLLDPKHGYVAAANPKTAKVAVVELFDYHCSYCKRAAPLMKSILENEKDVKLVFREYPIFGQKSDYAAEMALASRDQGKFLDMHFAMMEASGDLTKDRIRKIAQKHGVDFAKLEKDRNAPDVASSIIETHDIVREMGVSGTPAFVIASLEGDYVNVVRGFDVETLIESIEDARAAN